MGCYKCSKNRYSAKVTSYKTLQDMYTSNPIGKAVVYTIAGIIGFLALVSAAGF